MEGHAGGLPFHPKYLILDHRSSVGGITGLGLDRLLKNCPFIKKVCHTREGGYPNSLKKVDSRHVESPRRPVSTGMTTKDPNALFQQAAVSCISLLSASISP
jgi:hypothetical protein